jgi:hypothetical protein
MANLVIDVTIAPTTGGYSATCTPSSGSKPEHGIDKVIWKVTGIPVGQKVRIDLATGMRPPFLMELRDSTGKCSPEAVVYGIRSASDLPPYGEYKGSYTVALQPVGGGSATVVSGTETLMIDKGGPPPENQIYPRDPHPGEDPHPGHGPGASG